jgi:hypothetical protein
MIEALDAGDGWFELPSPATGVLRAVFGRAAYVDFGDRLLAVGDAGVPSGPLHLRVRRLPMLVHGERVTLAESVAELCGIRYTSAAHSWGWEGVITLDGAARWRPAPVDAGGLARHAGLARAVLGGLRPALAGPILERVRGLVAAGDLVGAAHLLGGRGPGLTPAGDDVLAGILIVAAVGPDPVDAAVRAAAAEAAPTTDVARAFLRWAARGQSIAPVHDLLAAIAAGEPVAARRALERLSSIGASSGSDLAAGLGLALAAGQGSTRTTSTSGPRASVFET